MSQFTADEQKQSNEQMKQYQVSKLNNAQDAIKQAIEGGLIEGEKWKFVSANDYWAVWLDGNGKETTISVLNYFTDPLFWQALEKSRGWYAGEWKQKAMDYFQATVCDGETSDKFFQTLE